MKTAMAKLTRKALLLVVCVTCISGFEHTINEQLSYDEMMEAVQETYKASNTKPDHLIQAIRFSAKNGFDREKFSELKTTITKETSGVMTSSLTAEQSPELCLNHTNFAMEAMAQGQEWALRMFDAVDKFPSGFLDGNFVFLGSFDECERIYSNNTESVNLRPFRGKYCLISVLIPPELIGQTSIFNLPVLRMGICLADSCGNAEAFQLANSLMSSIPIGNGSLQVIGAQCQEHSLTLDTKAVIMLIICFIFVALIVCGTVYDVLWLQWSQTTAETENTSFDKDKKFKDQYQPLEVDQQQIVPQCDPGIAGQILLAFSLYTNSSKLLSAKTSGDTLRSINGIRVISMTWVILGHSYAFSLSYAGNSATFLSDMMKRFSFMAIINAEVAVDTFFVLSGLLVAYLALKEMEKHDGKMNWAMFYFHRFWRLTPPYMLILGVYHTLSAYWYDGPQWQQQGMEYEFCHDNWWTNLLYINNLVNTDKQCMSWSWYLANDMQFFVLSPLMFIPLYHSTILGLAICGGFLLCMTVTPFLISYFNDMPPSMFGGGENPTNGFSSYFTDYYVKPYCRMGPYIVGIVTGYILYKTKCKVKLNVFVNLCGWLVAAGLAVVVLYGLYDPLNGSPMSVSVSALYNATHKTVWAACICWVIFACSTRNGGFINTFLSWEAFAPLGRLTYCAYLVHPILMYTYLYGLRSPLYLWDIEGMFLYFGFLVWSYCVAYIASLMFESPMMGLEKALLKRGNKRK